MTVPPEGLLLLDKPRGPTSHDMVDWIRRLAGLRRVGHTGTLDPAATGLLPVVLGRATRLARFLPHAPKVYEGTFRIGLTTSTDDLTGEVLHRWADPLPQPETVVECARRFRGLLLQVPPSHSAKKVKGLRLYRLARRGTAVSPPAAEVEIQRFELRPTEDPGEWAFIAEVSTGTYIRALVRDLGSALGCGGVLASLRRVAIGSMRVSAALCLEGTEEKDRERVLASVLPLEAMPLEPPAVRLDDSTAARRFVSGVSILAPPAAPPGGDCGILGPSGRLLGVAEAVEGRLRPKVVLVE